MRKLFEIALFYSSFKVKFFKNLSMFYTKTTMILTKKNLFLLQHDKKKPCRREKSVDKEPR